MQSSVYAFMENLAVKKKCEVVSIRYMTHNYYSTQGAVGYARENWQEVLEALHTTHDEVRATVAL